MARLHKVRSSAAVVWTAAALMTACCQSGFAQDADGNAGQKALGEAEVIHAQVRIVAIYPATNSITLRGPHAIWLMSTSPPGWPTSGNCGSATS